MNSLPDNIKQYPKAPFGGIGATLMVAVILTASLNSCLFNNNKDERPPIPDSVKKIREISEKLEGTWSFTGFTLNGKDAMDTLIKYKWNYPMTYEAGNIHFRTLGKESEGKWYNYPNEMTFDWGGDSSQFHRNRGINGIYFIAQNNILISLGLTPKGEIVYSDTLKYRNKLQLCFIEGRLNIDSVETSNYFYINKVRNLVLKSVDPSSTFLKVYFIKS